MELGLARDGILALLVLITSYTDLRYARIRNVHTFPAMGVGLVLGGLEAGLSGVGGAGLGLGVGLLCMGLLYVMGVMKAGDVKLAMALGAVCGAGHIFRAQVLSFMLYLPVGLIYLAGRGGPGRLWTAVKRLGRFVYQLVHPALHAERLESGDLTLAPFGMVLGLAALLVHFFDWLGRDQIIPW